MAEGSSITRLNDKFVLLYSVGDFRLNNYKLGMAFSDTLIPPEGSTYQTVRHALPAKADGRAIAGQEIVYLLQSEYADRPNCIEHAVVGPGLGSVVEVGGRPWLFFHGYKPDDRDRRPQNRFVFRVPLALAIGAGEPRLDWLMIGDAK